MRDRLIELSENIILSCKANLCSECEHNNIDYPHCMSVHFAESILADGWMRPPVKVGDYVYAKFSATNEIEYYVIDKVSHNGSNQFSFDAHLENEDGYVVDILEFDLVDIGKTVFTDREDAVKALRGGDDK